MRHKKKRERKLTPIQLQDLNVSSITINGHHTSVESFLSDPQQYLKKPIPKEYLDQVNKDIQSSRSLPKKQNFPLEEETYELPITQTDQEEP